MIRTVRSTLAGNGTTAALVVLAAVVATSFLVAAGRNGDFAVDLRQAFLPAAERVLHGQSPFPEPDSPVVVSRRAYVYPPVTAVVLAPFAWLPHLAVAVAVTLLLCATVAGTLRLLGVLDVRCYAAAFLWGPVLASLQTANLSLLLALALAAVWRWRDRGASLAAGLALAVAPKLFLWPLLLWALATRRWRGAVLGGAAALLAILVAWAIVGFAGLTDYAQLTRRLSRSEEGDAYTVYALARAIGSGSALAWALWAAVGLAVAALGCMYARRGDDLRAFSLLVAAALLLTPVVWLHYFAVLLVPFAVARPRFDLAWLLPAVLIGSSGTGNGGVGRTVLVLAVAGATVALSLMPQAAGGRQVETRRSTTTESSL
jgi:hypothetical protein